MRNSSCLAVPWATELLHTIRPGLTGILPSIAWGLAPRSKSSPAEGTQCVESVNIYIYIQLTIVCKLTEARF